VTDDFQSVLVEYVRRALIHELGTRRVDVWLGKDGLVQHDVDELASIALDALAPILEDSTVRTVVAQHRAAGTFASPTPIDCNDW
jgi:hypothetical protein